MVAVCGVTIARGNAVCRTTAFGKVISLERASRSEGIERIEALASAHCHQAVSCFSPLPEVSIATFDDVTCTSDTRSEQYAGATS